MLSAFRCQCFSLTAHVSLSMLFISSKSDPSGEKNSLIFHLESFKVYMFLEGEGGLGIHRIVGRSQRSSWGRSAYGFRLRRQQICETHRLLGEKRVPHQILRCSAHRYLRFSIGLWLSFCLRRILEMIKITCSQQKISLREDRNYGMRKNIYLSNKGKRVISV